MFQKPTDKCLDLCKPLTPPNTYFQGIHVEILHTLATKELDWGCLEQDLGLVSGSDNSQMHQQLEANIDLKLHSLAQKEKLTATTNFSLGWDAWLKLTMTDRETTSELKTLSTKRTMSINAHMILLAAWTWPVRKTHPVCHPHPKTHWLLQNGLSSSWRKSASSSKKAKAVSSVRHHMWDIMWISARWQYLEKTITHSLHRMFFCAKNTKEKQRTRAHWQQSQMGTWQSKYRHRGCHLSSHFEHQDKLFWPIRKQYVLSEHVPTEMRAPPMALYSWQRTSSVSSKNNGSHQ